jgi:hypothetical protein
MAGFAMTAALEMIDMATLLAYTDAPAALISCDMVAISPGVASPGANSAGVSGPGLPINGSVTIDRFAAHPGGRPFSGDRSGGKL